jgi:hypothetical protein
MHRWIRPLFALLASIASGALHAQACGTVLVSSVTLTRNMDCSGYPYAFKAIRDGVTVNLNGKTIRGGYGTDGVVVTGVRGVTVRGPGRLAQLTHAIASKRSESLVVSGVDISDSLFGVELISSHAARIEHVRFSGNFTPVEIRQPAADGSFSAGGHTVYSNQFSASDFHGLRICGAAAGDNVVVGNSFAGTENFSLEISHESARNRIQNNKFRAGAWLGMRTTSDNLISGNVFERDSRGILLSPLPPSEDCHTRTGEAESTGNQLLKNLFYDTPAPIVLGHPHVPDGLVTSNRIGGNRFERAETAITLHVNTYFNDATGNTFIAVGMPVFDAGVGNIH